LPQISRYRIDSVESLGGGIKIFRLGSEGAGIGPFTPGQFVFMHILDEKGASVVKRAYSIASSPADEDLEFCIKMVDGQLTGRLGKLSEGDTVGIEGPFGHFTYTGQKKAGFMAGGTGVAPFLSMLRRIASEGTEGSFILFYSARKREDLVYAEELSRLQKANPGIKVVITLTREEETDWAGECGRINHDMIAKHAGDAKDFDWWVCGPMEMVKSMRVCLAGMGADIKRIKLESWG
jgi:ferredoxin-NADP reductase